MYSKILFFIFSINLLLFAEDNDKDIFWVQAGTGIGFTKFSNSSAGIGFLLSLNYENQNHNLSASFMHLDEFEMFDHPGEYIKSYSIKYGRSYDFSMRGCILPFPLLLIINKNFDYSIIGRVGVSYNKWLDRTNLIKNESFSSSYDSEVIHGFGVPIEFEIREEITSYLGLGFMLFTNINKVKTYWGFNFSILIGNF